MGMRASETAAMFMTNEKALEDRKLFVHNLGELLSQTREGVISCELDDNEIVTITYKGGGIHKMETQSGTKQAPEGYKVNPEFIETKTKRVQLLLQPSVVDAIKALAKRQGLSMNEAISQAIQEYVEKNNG